SRSPSSTLLPYTTLFRSDRGRHAHRADRDLLLADDPGGRARRGASVVPSPQPRALVDAARVRGRHRRLARRAGEGGVRSLRGGRAPHAARYAAARGAGGRLTKGIMSTGRASRGGAGRAASPPWTEHARFPERSSDRGAKGMKRSVRVGLRGRAIAAGAVAAALGGLWTIGLAQDGASSEQAL